MDATGPASEKLTIDTPEQVGIEFELAGVGSRFFAALIDFLCMLIFLVIAVVLALAGIEGRDEVTRKLSENAARSESWTNGVGATATILIMLAVFVVIWGYYIICEMLMAGASPGKRALGLRVIRDDGLPIGFSNSLLRNLVRIVDFMPWCYGVGLVTMFASSRSQRLGDLAAGTLVVRVQAAHAPAPLPAFPRPAASVLPARLSPRERKLILQFFDRQATLAPGPREQILRAIATPLRARFDQGSPLPDEVWLRELLSAELLAAPTSPPGGPEPSA
jgi:uncharacterized RDD family membrane protein YckC